MADERERTYQLQKRIQFGINTAAYLGVCLIAVLFLMMVSGERFSGFLQAIGLRAVYNEERGVYADCSDPSNRGNPFCERKETNADRSWSSMRKGGKGLTPFSLDSD